MCRYITGQDLSSCILLHYAISKGVLYFEIQFSVSSGPRKRPGFIMQANPRECTGGSGGEGGGGGGFLGDEESAGLPDERASIL